MRKYAADVSIFETCIDANLKMVKTRDPDNFPRRRNDVGGQFPKLPLNGELIYFKRYLDYPNSIYQHALLSLSLSLSNSHIHD